MLRARGAGQSAQRRRAFRTRRPLPGSDERPAFRGVPLPETPATPTEVGVPRSHQAAPGRAEQRPAPMQTRLAEIRPPAAVVARPRTYIVRSGETMAEVARRNGVNLQKLLSANPSIEPKRLRAGQTVNIPPQ